MRRVAVLLAALVAGAALAGMILRRLPALRDAADRLRASSSPSTRLYDRLAGALLGGLYDVIAAEVARADAAAPARADATSRAQILEIGPGPGHLMTRMADRCPGADIVGLDIDPAMIALARARVEAAGLGTRVCLVEGDVAAMPFAESAFDLVVSSFSAHHWPDGPAAFREIGRVLRPGAMALVYDLPDGWGRFETGSMGLEAAALAGGLEDGRVEPVEWPRGVRLVRRLVVRRRR